MSVIKDDEFEKEAKEAGSLEDTLKKRDEDRQKEELAASLKVDQEPVKKNEEESAKEEEQETDDFGIPADDTEENQKEEGEEEEQDPEERKPERAKDSQSGPNKENAKRRINKKVQSLNNRLEEEQRANEKLRRDKKVAQEETAAYRALEESEDKEDPKKEQLKEPKPEDFDLEDEDPEFIKKHTAWRNADIDKRVEAKLSQFLGKIQSNQEQTSKQNRQEEHYRRVEKSGNTNYDKEEETVIKVLGAKNVSGIIKLFDDADVIIKNLAYDRGAMDDTLEAVENGDKVGLIRLLERASSKQKGKTRKVNTPDSEDLDEQSASSEGSDKFFVEGATFS